MPLLHVFESIFMIFLMVAWIWVIIGVISELATRRSEYTSVMKRLGIDGLLAAIDKRIAALGE